MNKERKVQKEVYFLTIATFQHAIDQDCYKFSDTQLLTSGLIVLTDRLPEGLQRDSYVRTV